MPVFLPGKSHGQRGLVGYSSWGHKSRTRLSDHTTTHVEWAVHSSLVGILVTAVLHGPLSHDLTRSSPNISTWVPPYSALTRRFTVDPINFLGPSFQELPFPKPHCLAGYPQNGLWFLLVLPAPSSSGSPPLLSVVKLRGAWLSHRPHSIAEVVTSCQRRILATGVETCSSFKEHRKVTQSWAAVNDTLPN